MIIKTLVPLLFTIALSIGSTNQQYVSMERSGSIESRANIGKLEWSTDVSCSNYKKLYIKRAYAAAKEMARDFYLLIPGSDYQDAMDLWMGSDTRNRHSEGIYFNQEVEEEHKQYDDHLTLIKDTQRRLLGVFNNITEVGDAQLVISCRDINRFGRGRCSSNPRFPSRVTGAYAPGKALFANKWYIVVCPEFFDADYLLETEDAIMLARAKGIDLLDITRLEEPGTTGQILLHEFFHLEGLVTKGMETKDFAWGSHHSYDWARNYGTEGAIRNADSWAWAAFAIHLQKRFGLPKPPKPGDRDWL